MSAAVFPLLLLAGVLWTLAAAVIHVFPRGPFRLTLIAALAVLGSAACATGGALVLLEPGARTSLDLGVVYPLGTLRLEADRMSGFFLTLTGVVGGLLFLGRPGTLAGDRGKVAIAGLALLPGSVVWIFVASATGCSRVDRYGWNPAPNGAGPFPVLCADTETDKPNSSCTA